MPNPNARKLYELLNGATQRDLLAATGFDTEGVPAHRALHPAMAEQIAMWLASQGVLVISDAVLTDEAIQCLYIAPPDSTTEYREALSRLAKGE